LTPKGDHAKTDNQIRTIVSLIFIALKMLTSNAVFRYLDFKSIVVNL